MCQCGTGVTCSSGIAGTGVWYVDVIFSMMGRLITRSSAACQPGYYGASCLPCSCRNGTCNDGNSGYTDISLFGCPSDLLVVSQEMGCAWTATLDTQERIATSSARARTASVRRASPVMPPADAIPTSLERAASVWSPMQFLVQCWGLMHDASR